MLYALFAACAPPLTYAIEFDGPAEFGFCEPFRALEEFTVEAWAAWDGVEGGPVSSVPLGFTLWAGANASFRIGDGGPSVRSTGDILSDGQFHHLAGTFSANASALYVDGALVGREAVPAATVGSWQVHIGGEQIASDYFPVFHGRIDEMRLSNSVRYHEDFSPPAAPFTPDAHTLLLLHLDEGGGSSIVDATGTVECAHWGGEWVPGRM